MAYLGWSPTMDACHMAQNTTVVQIQYFQCLLHWIKIIIILGDPCVYGNLRCPQELTDAMIEIISDGSFNGYAPSTGHNEARKAVADYVSDNGVKYDLTDVLLFSGCSSAIENCITVLADGSEGHNILIPRPGFAIYRTLAEGIGVKCKYYDLLVSVVFIQS